MQRIQYFNFENVFTLAFGSQNTIKIYFKFLSKQFF